LKVGSPSIVNYNTKCSPAVSYSYPAAPLESETPREERKREEKRREEKRREEKRREEKRREEKRREIDTPLS
jgi:hypothetical protein